MIIDRLIDKIIEKQNPTALGLDTRLEYLPEEMLMDYNVKKDDFKGAGKLILEFNKRLIDGLVDIIPCVKLQVAYYEMYGHHGMKAYYKTIEYARQKGMIAIADAKRNDIGATCTAYANAYLGVTPIIEKSPFAADFVTVTPYLGSDGITPFIEVCDSNNKGIFVLVKTSNPSSGEFQDVMVDGQPMYMLVGNKVKQWGKGLIGKYGYSSVGAVVGATYSEQANELRTGLDSVFFLIPGYGAQGATGKDIVASFDSRGLGGVVNASRSIICAHQKEENEGVNFVEAARNAALAMQKDIIDSLKEAGKPLIKEVNSK